MQTPEEMAEAAAECYREGDMNGFRNYLQELNLLGIPASMIRQMFRQEGLSFPLSIAPPTVYQLPTNAA